jgi:hypothetical protein
MTIVHLAQALLGMGALGVLGGIALRVMRVVWRRGRVERVGTIVDHEVSHDGNHRPIVEFERPSGGRGRTTLGLSRPTPWATDGSETWPVHANPDDPEDVWIDVTLRAAGPFSWVVPIVMLAVGGGLYYWARGG